jgi:hypothetical protein
MMVSSQEILGHTYTAQPNLSKFSLLLPPTVTENYGIAHRNHFLSHSVSKCMYTVQMLSHSLCLYSLNLKMEAVCFS